ncbi:N-methyltryptophan oxidase [Bordetella genomosp. 10]|uniref:N-methyltryptophan oxidase n=1 Tax=Bordetella genomosp. 10 TaxID=1416804 RepID=A0A261SJK4_9BORD|nr:N-methyl-L-tryptophan oxidase [Bordetella genomosp. 10]OZI36940.1 N-methyltryptophan oxidase [Bordetella genomosp. 10]
METRVDVAVIGLGAMGSATLYQLAKRGVKAIGIERYAAPHALGSSHGETRITRQAVGEGPDYVPLVLASHRIWRELEAATGASLLNACGTLIMSPRDNKALHHGMPDFVSRSIKSATAFDIPHEVIDSAEIARRFPQFVGLSGREWACYEPGGGYVRPEACIEAQLGRARALGAEIRSNTVVQSVAQEAGGVRIVTDQGVILADRAVVSAGSWCADLLGGPFERLLTVTRQLLHWYEIEDVSAYGAAASPVFIWMHGERETDYFYGFPPSAGDPRLKVATEQYATSTTPYAMDREVAPEESAAMYRDHVQGRLAGVTPRVAKAAACLYTVTPDRRFIIDRHPEQDRITVISACSGHGFKHSAGIGEAVAQSVAEGRSDVDLAPFSIARFRQA